MSTHIWYAHSLTGVPLLIYDHSMETKWNEIICLTNILFVITPHQARLWESKQCTVLLTAIMGPQGPIMPPDLPQSQPPLLPPFAQPQGGLHGTSYYLIASSTQHIISHATATHTKNSTGGEKKGKTDRSSKCRWKKRLRWKPCADCTTKLHIQPSLVVPGHLKTINMRRTGIM